MADPLESAYLKLNRGLDHLHELDDEVRRFAVDEMQRLRSENDAKGFEGVPQATWLTSSLGAADPVQAEMGGMVQIRRELPPRFGVVLGDFLGNLRSALDHAVNGAAGDLAGDFTKFPIIAPGPKHRDKWRSAVKGDLEGPPGPCRAAIERMQPYHGHRRGQRLLLLSTLCNIDKHHVLHPTKWLSYHGINKYGRVRGGGMMFVDTGVLGDEAKTNITFDGPYDAPKVEGGAPYQIGFGRAPGLDPIVMRVDLTILIEEVRGIIVEIGDYVAPSRGQSAPPDS